mgnify:CR=1 FL=1
MPSNRDEAYEKSVELHRKHGGKMEIRSKVPLLTQDDLSLAYTPGVARVCERNRRPMFEDFGAAAPFSLLRKLASPCAIDAI